MAGTFTIILRVAALQISPRQTASKAVCRGIALLRTGKAQIVKQMRPALLAWVPALYQGRAQLAALGRMPF